jgi:hypothetical protein
MLEQERRKLKRGGRRVVRATRSTIVDHLNSSVGVCLGLGFGCGLLIGVALASAAERDRHRYLHKAGDYGRKVYHSLAEATPDWLGGRS